jgi:hypothetical protein
MPIRTKDPSLRNRLWSLLVCMAAAVFLLAGLQSAPASAAPYAVKICAPGGDEPVLHDENSSKIETEFCGSPFFAPEGAAQEIRGADFASGAQRWTLEAPTGAKIHQISFGSQEFSSRDSWIHGIEWTLSTGADAGSRVVLVANENEVSPDSSTRVTHDIDSESVSGLMACVGRSSCEANSFARAFAYLSQIELVIEDNSPPTADIEVSKLPAGPVRGAIEIHYVAHDDGSGLTGAALFVDGAFKSSFSDENHGKCRIPRAIPFFFLAPCKHDITDESFSLDTTKLSDGPHTLNVIAGDATGQQQGSVHQPTIIVHNAPTNETLPSITGPARIGGVLVASPGAWEGEEPSSFRTALQWFRCPASVTKASEAGSCTAISGETGMLHEPSSAEVNQRDMVRVTATNSHGSESAFSDPSSLIAGVPKTTPPVTPPPDTRDKTPPVLTSVSLTHRKFKVAKADTALAASAKGARGTVLKFTSSEAGKLAITIAPPKKQKGKKKAKPIILTRTIAAGPGQVPISGRIARKALTPGSYHVTLAATDAAGNSAKQAVGLSFTILRG